MRTWTIVIEYAESGDHVIRTCSRRGPCQSRRGDRRPGLREHDKQNNTANQSCGDDHAIRLPCSACNISLTSRRPNCKGNGPEGALAQFLTRKSGESKPRSSVGRWRERHWSPNPSTDG